VAQEAECLPSKNEVLSSNPNTALTPPPKKKKEHLHCATITPSTTQTFPSSQTENSIPKTFLMASYYLFHHTEIQRFIYLLYLLV
jgi:hypothetical protein